MPELTIKAKLSLYKKSQQSGIDVGTLEEVYSRGFNTWTRDDYRSPQQLGFDRVNSFISGGEAVVLDEDLREEVSNGEKIAKDKKDPSARFIGSNSLVAILKKQTPGEIPVVKFTKQEIEKRITNEEQRMYSEKNFGLPMDLVNAVKDVLEGKAPGFKKPGAGSKPDEDKTRGDEKQDKDDGIKSKDKNSDVDETDSEDKTKKGPGGLVNQGKEADEDENAESGAEKTELSGGKTPVDLNPKTDDDPEGGEKNPDIKKSKSKQPQSTTEHVMSVRAVLDEISRKTLGSYVKKATDDVSYHSYEVGAKSGGDTMAADDAGREDKDYRKSDNREHGIKKAVNRLVNPHAVSLAHQKNEKRKKHSSEFSKKLDKMFSKEDVEFSPEELEYLDTISEKKLDIYAAMRARQLAKQAEKTGDKELQKKSDEYKSKVRKEGMDADISMAIAEAWYSQEVLPEEVTDLIDEMIFEGFDREEIINELSSNLLKRLGEATKDKNWKRSQEQHPVSAAYLKGYYGKKKENNLPKGSRHDAFEMGKKSDENRIRKLSKEEVEFSAAELAHLNQIDELSKEKLKAYIPKADASRLAHQKAAEDIEDKGGWETPKWRKHNDKTGDREHSIDLAHAKLSKKPSNFGRVKAGNLFAKEEVEKKKVINEISPAQLAAFADKAGEAIAYHSHHAARSKDFEGSLKHMKKGFAKQRELSSMIRTVLSSVGKKDKKNGS